MKKFKLQVASKMVLKSPCRRSGPKSLELTNFQEAPSAPVLRYGLTEIHAPTPASSAQVDVVFVHGLNGDPKKTWTSKSGNVFWPEDLLPSFIHDFNVRVLVYGYDADILSFATKGTGVTKDKIHNHAERLVADLFANRRVSRSIPICRTEELTAKQIRKASERPIIFVAHSLGGLVVKRVCLPIRFLRAIE